MNFQPTLFPFAEWALARDHELFQRVVARLRLRHGSKVRDFQIAARAEGLVLRGEVSTYYGKQLAQEVVMQVFGRSILSNDIEVQCRDAARVGGGD